MSVTITFTGTPSQIHSDMRAMLNLERGTAATMPAPDAPLPKGFSHEQMIMDKVTKAAAETPAEALEAATPAAAAPKKTRGKAKAKTPDNSVFEQPARDPEESFETKQHDAKAEEPTSNVAAPISNKEAVHQALQQVNVAVGLPKAREILTKFKVNRISEIKEDQFKAFIEECNSAVMMA